MDILVKGMRTDEKTSLCIVISNTHELFREGGVTIYVLIKLAPKHRQDLNPSDQSKYNSLRVEHW